MYGWDLCGISKGTFEIPHEISYSYTVTCFWNAYSAASHYLSAILLSIGPLGTNFSEILIKIQNVLFTKLHLNISSAKWRPFCPGGDELITMLLVKQAPAQPDLTEHTWWYCKTLGEEILHAVWHIETISVFRPASNPGHPNEKKPLVAVTWK